jgi:lipoprotein-anchoring transpeptidase ErfK/SrfK
MLAFPASAETNPSQAPAEAAETSPDTTPPGVTAEQESTEAPDAATSESDDAPVDGDAAATSESDDAPADGDSAAATSSEPKTSILIDIDKSTQEMTVFVDGVEKYSWPVSTGMSGYSTPSGTFTASSMNEIWYSRQWDNAPMPHAIFFTKKGHAIHGTTEEKRLGNAASHGCVRLSRANAQTLFQLVKATGLENTQVVLSGTTKGGEGPKVASPSPSSRDAEVYPPWFEPGDNFQQPQRRKRRGLFGRRWFQPGPQGYYAPRGNYYYRRGY